MQAFEHWPRISQELNHTILEAAYEANKKLYRNLVQEMSSALRKRKALLQQMPRQERHLLFQPILGLPNYHVLSQNLLMNWLAEEKVDMICEFLDALGIEHDGRGFSNEFPESMDKAKLQQAVEKIYDQFEEQSVTAYLSTFDSLTGMTWEDLPSMLRNTEEPAEASEEA